VNLEILVRCDISARETEKVEARETERGEARETERLEGRPYFNVLKEARSAFTSSLIAINDEGSVNLCVSDAGFSRSGPHLHAINDKCFVGLCVRLKRDKSTYLKTLPEGKSLSELHFLYF
jgi:hypothetical protein